MKIIYAVLYQTGDKLTLGQPHKTRACAEASVSPFEGATVLGFVTGKVELLPEPVMGMRYALDRRADPHATLRTAEAAGARIQANRGTEDVPKWETIEGRAQFSCTAHLYRVHPEDTGG